MENQKKYDVIALGELLIDFTPAGISAQGNPVLEQNREALHAMSWPCWQDTAGAPDSSARLETTSMEGSFAELSGKRESAAADL